MLERQSAYDRLPTGASVSGRSRGFQPFAQANNPKLGKKDDNPKKPVSWILYLDFNACTRPQ